MEPNIIYSQVNYIDSWLKYYDFIFYYILSL